MAFIVQEGANTEIIVSATRELDRIGSVSTDAAQLPTFNKSIKRYYNQNILYRVFVIEIGAK
jgi:hypothetical protein